MKFKLTVVDSKGNRKEMTVCAENRQSAIVDIKSQGFLVIKLAEMVEDSIYYESIYKKLDKDIYNIFYYIFSNLFMFLDKSLWFKNALFAFFILFFVVKCNYDRDYNADDCEHPGSIRELSRCNGRSIQELTEAMRHIPRDLR